MNTTKWAWTALLIPLGACASREYIPDGDLKRPLTDFQRLVAKPLQIDPALAASLQPENLARLQKVAEAFPKQLQRRLIIRRILDAPEGKCVTLEGHIRTWSIERDPTASQREATWAARIEVTFCFFDDMGVSLGTGRGSASVRIQNTREDALSTVGHRISVAIATYLKRTLKGNPDADDDPVENP